MDAPLGDGLEKILGNEHIMEKIRELANEMSGDAGGAPASPPQTDISAPKQLSPSKVGGYCAILAALRPYLDEKRRERVDKMIRVLRLAETAKTFIGM